MTLTPEAREAGAKACYEHWISGAEGFEPAWTDQPDSHRERMRASFEAGAEAYAAMGGAVPAGWKLVPVEPTHEMRDVFWRAMFHEPPDDNSPVLIGAGYDAMLAAAPEPPTGTEGWQPIESYTGSPSPVLLSDGTNVWRDVWWNGAKRFANPHDLKPEAWQPLPAPSRAAPPTTDTGAL